jgi:sporulation protein YlmC with PRC-barrel domain
MKTHVSQWLAATACSVLVFSSPNLLGQNAPQGHAPSANQPQPPQPSAQPPPKAEPKPGAQQQPAAPAAKTAGTASHAPATPAAAPVFKRIPSSSDIVRTNSDSVFIDSTLRGRDGKELGQLTDLLVDPASGEVGYAVVRSGGVAGIGGTLRLVPFKAIEANKAMPREFTVTVSQTEWEQLSPLERHEFETGRVTIPDSENRQIAERFRRAKRDEASRAPAEYTADISRVFVRSTRIHGKDVRADGREIGKIEALRVDANSGKAAALFRPNPRFLTEKRFGGAPDLFEVPLGRLSLSGEKRDVVTATLARADFEPVAVPHAPGPVQAAAQNEKTAPAAPASGAQPQQPEKAPTPTGKTSAEQAPAGASAELLRSAQAVRASLDSDAASKGRVEVQVSPEKGRLVLRGSVADEQRKKSIEEQATKAASGVPLDSQITVQAK